MPKPHTLKEIAESLGGQLVGDGALTVTRVAHPSDIRGAEDLALAMDPKLLPLLMDGKARAARPRALPPCARISWAEGSSGLLEAYIAVERPRLALAKLTNLFFEPVALPPGIHPTACVEPGAVLGKNVTLGAFVSIGASAVIGEDSILHPHVSIGPGAYIGAGALIHSGVRIGRGVTIGARFIGHFNASVGADGFSFVTPQPGSVEQAKQGSASTVTAANHELIRIASLGGVVIGDDVEIRCRSAIT